MSWNSWNLYVKPIEISWNSWNLYGKSIEISWNSWNLYGKYGEICGLHQKIVEFMNFMKFFKFWKVGNSSINIAWSPWNSWISCFVGNFQRSIYYLNSNMKRSVLYEVYPCDFPEIQETNGTFKVILLDKPTTFKWLFFSCNWGTV